MLTENTRKRGTAASTSGKPRVRRVGAVGAAQAKAHLLSLINEVKESGTSVIITKRGEPQVKLAPLDPLEPAPDIIGCMKGTFTVTGDIIGPEPDVWEAML